MAKVENAYAKAVATYPALTIVKTCRGILAANKGQNRFGEVVGPFLSRLRDFSDYNDCRYTRKRMDLDNVLYLATGSLPNMWDMG